MIKIDVNGNIVNPFKAVGFLKIADSGKSLRIEINNHPTSIFIEVYYVSRDQVTQVLHGHRKEATIYVLDEEKQQEPDM